MARRAHAYPQVEPGAEALVDARAVRVDRGASVAAALGLARKRDATVVLAGHATVLRADLARAAELGLGARRAAELARPLPRIDARTSEVTVRRALANGARAVVVMRRGVPVGVVTERTSTVETGSAMASAIARRLTPDAGDLLRTAAAVAAREHRGVWLVGGVVRDLLLSAGGEGPPGADLDLAVEGDGHRVARALAEAVGGTLILHDRFLTASVDVPGLGTVDVITARSERYVEPGALPRVMPAGIRQDLERRDFTVNAMAIALDSDARTLLDFFGGRVDLARRRLRILHPLSFVEDPTRMFRAARYAARLGLGLDPWSAGALRLALRLAPYPALSGTRIVAELERIAGDAGRSRALAILGAAGVFRLLDPRYRYTRATASRVAALDAARVRLASLGLDVPAVELVLVVLLGDQPSVVRDSALRRLGLAGEPGARIARAVEDAAGVDAALAGATAASVRARLLRGRSPTELGALCLLAGQAAGAAVEEYLTRTAGIAAGLRGDDVIALGVPRGPEVARVLAAVRDAKIDAEVGDRDGEAEYVRRWVTSREGR